MSSSLRQSELFASQDWQVIYRAFTEVNFNASDPASINRSLREYIQTNYAEDFSDWIASSEFVALIDLLAYLAGTVAFKIDINARENFLEVAEARESVLRLARFLSYNPKRNVAAQGLLKLVRIETDDEVFDAFGVNMQNRAIRWNDSDDPDWFEKMVIVLNSSFIGTNSFGVPLKNETVAGVRAQLYRFNSRGQNVVFPFSKTVAGVGMPFEIFNTDFSAETGFFERAPDFGNAMHIAYRSDGNGNGSPQTGFFVGFKQGTLSRSLFSIASRSENLLIDVETTNVNESDVWVQSLTEAGTFAANWEKVPAIFSSNVTFNDIPVAQRNIFSVVTRDADTISIRFSDGRFGTAPLGNLRIWHRSSNGLQYQIRPQDMQTVVTRIPYTNRLGLPRTLTATFALEEPVSNAARRETEADIKLRAPAVYSTQNRMVSGEDYNTFPLSSNLTKKIKALNRTYSGHSRFIDLNDPTGMYKDLTVFADDGIFYKEEFENYYASPLYENRSAEELVDLLLQPMLADPSTRNYVREFFLRQAASGAITVPSQITFNALASNDFTTTGWFSSAFPYAGVGALLHFEADGRTFWSALTEVDGFVDANPAVNGFAPVRLSGNVPTGSRLLAVLPNFGSRLSADLREELIQKFEQQFSFSLWYDYNNADEPYRIENPTTASRAGTRIKIADVDYLSDALWRFVGVGLRYVFESERDVRFFYDGKRGIDPQTGRVQNDYIRVLRFNDDLQVLGSPLPRDFDLSLAQTISYTHGPADPRRITVVFADNDENGYADAPDTFLRLSPVEEAEALLFWERADDDSYQPVYHVHGFENETGRLTSALPVGSVAFQAADAAQGSFWVRGETGWMQSRKRYRSALGRGRNVARTWTRADGLAIVPAPKPISFKWKHHAASDRRIDPSKTNIIDIFVLTREYDFQMRQWVALGADPMAMPKSPTGVALQLSFGALEQFRVFSDEIVWHPVRYKLLFGTGADAVFRARFKIVKIQNAALSDGEIKAQVVRAINAYFDADLWDFGETFYFTELAAYLHQQLANIIASVVIVPVDPQANFGNGFEVTCRSDELFLSTAQIGDISIITANTNDTLRIS
jgi:hypothetical protein